MSNWEIRKGDIPGTKDKRAHTRSIHARLWNSLLTQYWGLFKAWSMMWYEGMVVFGVLLWYELMVVSGMLRT
jgi:hypothetical protein